MGLFQDALQNPAITIALGTLVLFAIARVPSEIFYSKFGIRPEDVGLNSVQVLLQGTTTVLLLSLGVGLVYGLGLPLLNAAYYGLFGWLIGKAMGDSATTRWWHTRAGRLTLRMASRNPRLTIKRILRLAPILVPTVALAFSALLLVTQAISDADAIKDGENPQSGLGPWRAERVSAWWTDPSGRLHLPTCHHLFYLGEANSRVVLFDSQSDRTYRLEGSTIQLAFPLRCS